MAERREIDSGFTLYVGDVIDALAQMPDESVHCCVTSPPYWGLRDYGEPGQIGLEATPDLYVERMVGVFRDVRRVLRADGTLWLNIGDSYNNRNVSRRSSHQGGLGFDSPDLQKSWVDLKAEGRTRMSIENGDLKEKDLVGIPWMLAFALRADGWYLRSDIIWAKPNPMPESVRDRPTKAHEYLFLLTKSPRYFYDADAIREPHAAVSVARAGRARDTAYDAPGQTPQRRSPDSDGINPAGRNKRTVWTIATQSYKGAHFATFPEALAEQCILAGCPEWMCATCGAPRERIVERQPMIIERSDRAEQMGEFGRTQTSGTMVEPARSETIGWTDCDHDNYAPGTVLDPFLGSATTAQVARSHGRQSIGIELNPEYAELAVARYHSATRVEKRQGIGSDAQPLTLASRTERLAEEQERRERHARIPRSEQPALFGVGEASA